jgi:hypothetical protein
VPEVLVVLMLLLEALVVYLLLWRLPKYLIARRRERQSSAVNTKSS